MKLFLSWSSSSKSYPLTFNDWGLEEFLDPLDLQGVMDQEDILEHLEYQVVQAFLAKKEKLDLLDLKLHQDFKECPDFQVNQDFKEYQAIRDVLADSEKLDLLE